MLTPFGVTILDYIDNLPDHAAGELELQIAFENCLPALRRLVDLGCLETESLPGFDCIYSLTPKGRQALDTHF